MENIINKALRNTLSKFIKEETDLWYSDYKLYQEKYDEELIEFLHLDKNRFGIPVDLFVDDGYAYVHHNHPLWVYMCNGYDVNDDIIPLSVDDNPQILIPNVKLNISNTDFNLVKEFIKVNKDLIVKLANDIIKNVEFLKSVKCLALSEQYKNNGLLLEMARISRDDTGLPTDIFVDATVRQTKHGKRIKFKADETQRYSSEYTPITISDNPIIPVDYKVDSRLFNIIRQFVILNKELLENLSDGKITVEYFIENMVRFNNGKPIQKQRKNDFSYQTVTKCMNGFIMIKSQNDLLNFLNTNNKIVSPKQWFTNAQPFINYPNGIYAMVQIDDTWYWLSENGELTIMD